MIATIIVRDKDVPAGIAVNPEVFIILCQPGCPFSYKQYSNEEVATMMRKAELTAFNFSSEKGRLAVINHHVNLGFRLTGSLFVPTSGDQRPMFEYYMELPPDFR